MPIEAELKARVRDVPAVRAALAARAHVQPATYWDAYFDRAADGFMAGGRELRLRTVETPQSVRTVLTFKAPAVDEASGSKPEFETVVDDREAAAAILAGPGYTQVLAFSKQCENFKFTHAGNPTLVTVPEIDGTFLEVETVVESSEALAAALDAVREVMHGDGIGLTLPLEVSSTGLIHRNEAGQFSIKAGRRRGFVSTKVARDAGCLTNVAGTWRAEFARVMRGYGCDVGVAEAGNPSEAFAGRPASQTHSNSASKCGYHWPSRCRARAKTASPPADLCE